MNEKIKRLEKNGLGKLLKKKEVRSNRLQVDLYREILGRCLSWSLQGQTIGYTQTYDIDYEENFTLVGKMNVVHILLSLVAHSCWELHQFDVNMLSYLET